jgi:biopolymer transport protein ExbD
VEIAEHLTNRGRVYGSVFTLMRRRSELLGRVTYLTKEESIMKLGKIRMTALVISLMVAIMSLSWYHGTANPPAPEHFDQSRINVSLSSGKQVTVDGKKSELEKLGKILLEDIDNKDAVINLVCADDVPMSTLFQVHAILRGADMLKVSYSGLGGKNVPLKLPDERIIEKARSIPAEDLAELMVYPGGKCTLDGMKIKPASIHKHVAERLAGNDHLVVSLTMDEAATYGQYVQVLQELRTAQANRIFINEPGSR